MQNKKDSYELDEVFDEDFREMAINACEEIGLPEDEAELLVDDYLAGY